MIARLGSRSHWSPTCFFRYWKDSGHTEQSCGFRLCVIPSWPLGKGVVALRSHVLKGTRTACGIREFLHWLPPFCFNTAAARVPPSPMRQLRDGSAPSAARPMGAFALGGGPAV